APARRCYPAVQRLEPGCSTRDDLFVVALWRPPLPTLFPYTTLFRSAPAGPRRHVLRGPGRRRERGGPHGPCRARHEGREPRPARSEEHTSELQSRENLVCRLLLDKTKTNAPLGPIETMRSRHISHTA